MDQFRHPPSESVEKRERDRDILLERVNLKREVPRPDDPEIAAHDEALVEAARVVIWPSLSK